jgi:type I restriction enzyme M protein
MKWVAPSEKNEAQSILEKRLWNAADQLRANSGLTSAQYSQPVLGLIFLRFADARFSTRRADLEKKAGKSSRRASPVEDPASYHAERVIFLPEGSRYDELLEFPEGGRGGKTLGQAVNDAMTAIERENPQLAGVLPRGYQTFDSRLLKELLKAFSSIPADAGGDAFGRIYEYFLSEFAMSEGQAGGEFYTPESIVRLLVEVLEPFHGRILDPACGSGGMFVSSARFVAEHKRNPATELAIHGQEKVAETTKLCRMNLAVHGLEGDIREAITYYDDPHKLVGRFDFVLANPPFNVDSVDKDRLKDHAGAGRRFPFGMPKADNANYLWIQLFHSALNEQGRAGFVMANSASDARSSEQDIRQRLIEEHCVDAVVAVGPNMFYTVTLPCALWFIDKGKINSDRKDKVLFVDARNIYRQVTRAVRDWTPAQIGFLANIVRLYRGEQPDFTLGGGETEQQLNQVFGNQPKYADIEGLCKSATLTEIKAQSWSLNPGRYVGTAKGEEASNEDFKKQLSTLNQELEALNAKSRALEEVIAVNVAEILKS